MRRQGTPESATTSLFNTLQEATHQVRMAHRFRHSFWGTGCCPNAWHLLR